MRILVTGSAGFIGSHLALHLLEQGHRVTGLDNLSPFSDVTLKEARLARISGHPGFSEARLDLADREAMAELFAGDRFDRVAHMAAQAGVRYSLENPVPYVESNLVGFVNLLEGCRAQKVDHLVFASSSSVYGANTHMPYSTHDQASHPISLYAATKRSNELLAHSYSHLFHLPCTGLRFFTVYGPWGRPDMAPLLFAKAILSGEPIDVFNQGDMKRDFTYVDDIVEGVVRTLDCIPQADPSWSAAAPDPASSGVAPFRIFNIGNGEPVGLMDFIAALEKELGREAQKHMKPMQTGDVRATWADVDDLARETGFRPSTSVDEGVARFVEWYREYYGLSGGGA